MVFSDMSDWEVHPDQTSLGAFSLKYPLSDGWKPIGIGAIISPFAYIFVVPIIILWGYRYRISRAGVRGDESAPIFNDFGSIIWNGVLLGVAFLPYGFVITLLTMVILGLGSTVNEPFILLIILSWFIIASYAGVAIHPTFVATGSIRETYSGLLFLRVAATREYLVGFLFGIILRLSVGMAMLLLLVLSGITLIGPFIVLSIWYAYDEFISGAIWGHVARDLAEQGLVPAVTVDADLDL